MMLKSRTIVTVNAAWPATNETAAGATAASKTAGGSKNQMNVVSFPIASSRSAPTKKPIAVPASPRMMFCPVASAFDRSTEERAEHDPERMLDTREVGDEDCDREADRAAQAVVEPHRMPLEVSERTSLRRGQRAGEARRLVPQQPVGEAPALGRRCESDVGRDLGDREPELLGAEPRVERIDDRGRPARPGLRRPGRQRLAPRAPPARAARAATPRRPARAPREAPDRASSTSAASSRAAAAASFTRYTVESTPTPSGWAWTTIAFSHVSSSTSLTSVLAAVVSPVGR